MMWTAITIRGACVSYFVYYSSHDKKKAFEEAKLIIKDRDITQSLISIIAGNHKPYSPS